MFDGGMTKCEIHEKHSKDSDHVFMMSLAATQR